MSQRLESTLAHQLETRIPGSQSVNLAANGYSTVQELVRLERQGLSYDPDFRGRLAAICGGGAPDSAVTAVERDLTLRHADLVRRLLAGHGVVAGDVGVVGFHGHTIEHAPTESTRERA